MAIISCFLPNMEDSYYVQGAAPWGRVLGGRGLPGSQQPAAVKVMKTADPESPSTHAPS